VVGQGTPMIGKGKARLRFVVSFLALRLPAGPCESPVVIQTASTD
jgi:hypothetical protein